MSMTHPDIFECKEDTPILYYVCGLLSELRYTEAITRIGIRMYESYTREGE